MSPLFSFFVQPLGGCFWMLFLILSALDYCGLLLNNEIITRSFWALARCIQDNVVGTETLQIQNQNAGPYNLWKKYEK